MKARGTKAKAKRGKAIFGMEFRQLTIRGIDEDLGRAIRELAMAEGISLNQAVQRLVRKGAGLEPGGRKPKVIGHALDKYIGTMTEEDARNIAQAVRECRVIDEDMWK